MTENTKASVIASWVIRTPSEKPPNAKKTESVTSVKTMIRLFSPNFDERKTPVEMLVLHYTGMKTAKEALDRLRDPAAKVSAHYVIDENGSIYSLVAEDKRAWHAGVSSWNGKTDINSRSVGIEIVNPGHEFGYHPFADVQIQSVIDLSKEIIKRHSILIENIVGHSDVAPTRKPDPGKAFFWKALAEQGIGFWYDSHDDLPDLIRTLM